MKKLWNYLEQKMNNYTLVKKMIFIYVFCVILPLVITDTLLLELLIQGQAKERAYECNNISNAVQMELEYTIADAAQCINGLYVNRDIYRFMDTQFESAYEYYDTVYQLLKKTPIDLTYSYNISNVVLYGENKTIVNGGHFSQMEKAMQCDWYEPLMNTTDTMVLDFYYVGDTQPWTSAKRKISLVRHMNYEKGEGGRKIICADIDYARLAKKIVNLNYGNLIYVCQGERILFTNDGHYASDSEFQMLTGEEKILEEKHFQLLGQEYRILFTEGEDSVLMILAHNKWLLLAMVALNILLPLITVNVINRSITKRLLLLSKAFDNAGAESMEMIEKPDGEDEIGGLMRNYNQMAERMNDLIKTVYKDRIEKQEIDIARQNAELLALHAQINPHFMFNVLESIRMSCLIRKEEDTAFLIEQLATLERQTVSWKEDQVYVQEELRFIKAYLDLQKHRFGDRLEYYIQVEEECERMKIPKLTLVTFVENACIHGVEQKSTTSYLYVRIYREGRKLCMEIEDTGNGMDEFQLERLRMQMNNCNIETLRESTHVGIINACLRLKMYTHNQVSFEIESESGAGTFITIVANLAPFIS